ncbi:MAG: Uma2 family endonuclease [Lachnospiraceae bacterium]|nr:Uma2 family endonuclease [Lachnospiraceae bacterium]
MKKWKKLLSETDTGRNEIAREDVAQGYTEYLSGEAEAGMVAEAAEEYVLSQKGESFARLVSDVLAEYAMTRKHGKYTLEDYLALPEDQRVELIDGVFYDMAAPNYIHQGFGDRILAFFNNYIDEHHGSCYAFTSPIDVQLDCDDKTVVQPDVLIVCDMKKFRNGRVFGAPDLVVEVLSKSTSSRDRGLKLAKYKLAGVREYWLIDPRRKRVLVYEFEKRDSAKIYGFADTVPVGIYDGACAVDFARIYDRMRLLYETM